MRALLLDAVVSLAEAETGSRPCLEALGRSRRIPVVGAGGPRRLRGARWTPEEDDFLRAKLGYLSEAEIGRALGRSRIAVSNRWKRDLHLISPRRNPNWLTLEAFAHGLGMDQKSVAKLVDRGMIPSRRLPAVVIPGKALIRVVDCKTALAWIADPMHWLYFKPDRVGAFRKQEHRHAARPNVVFWRAARAAIDARRRTWRDAWLSPTEAGALMGLPLDREGRATHQLNKAIRRKLLPAVRWGNWWILRSEARRFAHERVRGSWGPRKIKRINFKIIVCASPRDRQRMLHYLRRMEKAKEIVV